jgi:ribonuclease Y
MVVYILMAAISAGVVGFITGNVIQSKRLLKQAELDAEAIRKASEMQAKNLKREVEREIEQKKMEAESLIARRLDEIARREREIQNLLQQEQEKRELYERKLEELERERASLERLQEEYKTKLREVEEVLENRAGLTKKEAEEILMNKVKEELRQEVAHLTRRILTEAEQEAREKANYILAQATTRYAGEFAGERLVNVVDVKNVDMKGRIIGISGRNIKTLEQLTGCDIIVNKDDPNPVVEVSSFNIYRRQIAVETIKRLVEQGIINPARIEETYQKVAQEFEERVEREGEKIVVDLGLITANIHPELLKLIGRLKYRASFGQNALAHSLEVAYMAGIIAAELGGDELLARRAGLLHDIGKALSHEVGGDHVSIGYDLCKRYGEPEEVLNAIKAHHGYEEPRSIEAAAVCAADVLSAARPGARRDAMEQFLKRMEKLEEIATSFPGVLQAYGMNSGRELRVIVEADLINDDEAVWLSHEIAKRVSREISFPGFIKVNVIRQSRFSRSVNSTYYQYHNRREE